MKIVKLFTFFLFFSLSLNAFAQDKTKASPEEVAKKSSEKMKKELGLNDDQTGKTYNLVLEKVKKRRELMEKNKGNMKAFRKEFAPHRKEFGEAMKAILTPEQYTKWEEARKKRAAEKKGKLPESLSDDEDLGL